LEAISATMYGFIKYVNVLMNISFKIVIDKVEKIKITIKKIVMVNESYIS